MRDICYYFLTNENCAARGDFSRESPRRDLDVTHDNGY